LGETNLTRREVSRIHAGGIKKGKGMTARVEGRGETCREAEGHQEKTGERKSAGRGGKTKETARGEGESSGQVHKKGKRSATRGRRT